MSRSRSRALASLTSVALGAGLLSSCAAFSGETTRQDDGELRVVAAFYPLEYVAQRVLGEVAEVQDLTSPGQEPHDVELSVAANAEVASADLIVFQGGLQAAVDEAVRQSAEGTALDVTEVVDLREVGEHADDHDHEEHGDEVDGHDEDLDPHFWLDPLEMAEVGEAVAEGLSAIDPAHAGDYDERAAELRADLEELDTEYEEGLATCERDVVVVGHDAFGYLDRYGLTFEPVAGLSPDAEPSPADLARLQQLIESEGVTTVFSERLASPRLTRTLAQDAGVDTAVLDPIEGLTEETADEDYLSLMRANLSALQEANGCR